MDLTEDELDNLIYQIETNVCGEEVAIQRKRSYTDEIWSKVLLAGFEGDLADQIVTRYHKKDYDYTTKEGVVISNVFFPMEGSSWSENKRPSDVGAKDLPLSQLGNLNNAQYRPKLPGKMLTKMQVAKMGRRTCYDLVERVGDTLFGIFPYDIKCNCCRSYKWQKKFNLPLESWQEGYMVLIDNIEYRAKRYPTIDRMYNSMVWEMQKVEGSWIPIRPREIGKVSQNDSHADWQVTVPMLLPNEEIKIPGKAQFIKILIMGENGPCLIQKEDTWQILGGRQILRDVTPVIAAEREYVLQLKMHPPNLIKVGSCEIGPNYVHLFFVVDRRLQGGHDPTLLEDEELDIWNEFFDCMDPELMSELKSTSHFNWLSGREGLDAELEQEQALLKMKVDEKKILYTTMLLPLKVDHFLSNGQRAYIAEDVPYLDCLQRCNSEEEVMGILTESFFLRREFGLRVGSSFFSVLKKEGRMETLLLAYCKRMKMQYKVQVHGEKCWFIAWSEGRLGEKRQKRYTTLPAHEWRSFTMVEDISNSRQSETELEEINKELFLDAVPAFQLFNNGSFYTYNFIRTSFFSVWFR